MSEDYKAVGNLSIGDVQRMNDAANQVNWGIKDENRAADPRYPKSLSPAERKTAAESIKSQLKGKTGSERAVKRAELMDPGSGDGALAEDDYEGQERKAIVGEKKSKGSTSFNFGANKKKPNAAPSKAHGWKTETPKNYEAEERKAIQGEKKSKGSVSFP
jgi:hypothetical protein